ncbi:MAG: ROK family protein [Blastocatellia bacterium AA13]|nr:MAG: ROK family protein [Blastocatellia bacterium AA13]
MSSYVLGIDLGGTKIDAALFDESHNIIGRHRDKTEAWLGEEEVFKRIVGVAAEAIKTAGIDASRISACGIGSPGPLDPDSGYIIETANLPFRNFPLGPRLSEEFKCHVVVHNDVDAGTYGEFRSGAGAGAQDVLGVFVGTGIGGGLIINGSLYNGFSKNAGEVGHMVIQAGGPPCGCGNRGCLEALASRTAMARDLKKAIKRGKRSKISKYIGKGNELLSSKDLKKTYEAGDELVRKVVHRAARYVGIGLGSLVNVLGPEIIVLGGGVVEAMGEKYIARVDRTMRKIAFEFSAKNVRVVKAQLGDDAGVIGAATLARESAKRVGADERT